MTIEYYPCENEYCYRPQQTRRLCGRHYSQWLVMVDDKNRDLTVRVTESQSKTHTNVEEPTSSTFSKTKICKTCLNSRPLHYFKAKKDNRVTQGFVYESYCKLCRQSANYSKRYGLTKDKLRKMYVTANNTCACCKKETNKLHIDHDHRCCPGANSCGKCVRGLICIKCNTTIGFIETAIQDGTLVGIAEYCQWTL